MTHPIDGAYAPVRAEPTNLGIVADDLARLLPEAEPDAEEVIEDLFDADQRDIEASLAAARERIRMVPEGPTLAEEIGSADWDAYGAACLVGV